MSEPYRECPETDDELLPVADLDDRTIGVATRREIHEKKMIHRAVHIILIDPDGRVLLQKRGLKKDRYPGWWDISVGGHVGVDEVYIESAVREVEEEMGVSGAEVQLAAILTPNEINGWEHIHLFFSQIDGEVKPHPEEISGHRWVDPDEYFAKASPDAEEIEWRVTPSSYESFCAWKRVGMPGRKPKR